MKQAEIKIGQLIIGIILMATVTGTGVAGARSLQITDDFLHMDAPLYLRVSAGNHQGCPDTGKCPSVHYQLRLSSSSATITLAKELLIGSDEILDNPLHDTGVPSSELEMEFSSEFYKGAIVKLYPQPEATLDDFLSIELTRDQLETEQFEIPFRLLSPDSVSILYTAPQVDQELEEWRDYADQLQLQVLFTGLEPDETPHHVRNKLEVVKRLLGMERVARTALLNGEISNLTYNELQSLWAIVWNNLLFNDQDVLIFAQRYQRLKNRYNKSITTMPQMVGNLKVLLQNIRYQHQLSE